MSFLHASLLAGLAVMIVPILIHFSGRKQPKTIAFPALRFVQATKITASRGWSVKRWLLLILRVLMLAVLVFALASPRVNGANFASWISIGLLAILGLIAAAATLLSFANRHDNSMRYGLLFITTILLLSSILWSGWVLAKGPAAPIQNNQGPVAVAIIIDTSPTMEYRFQNQTRLEKAKEIAKWIVNRLDAQSRIVVLTNSLSDRLQLGHAAAESQVDRIQTDGRPVELPSRIAKAIELVSNTTLQRQEVYVISDLSANAWTHSDESLRSIIAGNENVLLQLVDVGVDSHRNWAFDQVQLTQEVAAVGSSIDVSASIRSASGTPKEQIIVELLAEEKDPLLPVVRDGKMLVPKEKIVERRIIEAVGDGAMFSTSFTIADIAAGTNHYALNIKSTDPIEIDNRWPLTIDGVQGQKILLVDGSEPKPATNAPVASTVGDSAAILALMLDPSEKQVVLLSMKDFESGDLSSTNLIVLYNPSNQLPSAIVDRIEKFVASGGSLMLILGEQFQAAAESQTGPRSSLQNLLPGKVARLTRRRQRDVSLENVKPTHSIWREFGGEVAQVPWTRFPINRHWDIDEPADNAAVLARFTVSGKPAILEQSRGLGRIVTFTTPIPDIERAGHEIWNELSTATEPWASFGLMLGTARYLQITGDTIRNFEIGQTVFLHWDEVNVPRTFELFDPAGSIEQVALQDDSMLFGFANLPGQYRLRGSVSGGTQVRGFSVHLPVGATDLTRIAAAGLDDCLGADHYLLTNDKEALRESIGQGRYGRNLTPFLMVVIVGMYLAEQAMSQKYYSSNRTSSGMGHR